MLCAARSTSVLFIALFFQVSSFAALTVEDAYVLYFDEYHSKGFWLMSNHRTGAVDTMIRSTSYQTSVQVVFFNPDGKTIAFRTGRKLMIMNNDGSNLH
jgi:hypothetical protein